MPYCAMQVKVKEGDLDSEDIREIVADYLEFINRTYEYKEHALVDGVVSIFIFAVESHEEYEEITRKTKMAYELTR